MDPATFVRESDEYLQRQHHDAIDHNDQQRADVFASHLDKIDDTS